MTRVIEGSFDGHVVNAKQGRDCLQAHLGMAFFGGQATLQMGDMHGWVEQVNRDGKFSIGRLAFIFLPGRSQDGNGSKGQSATGPNLSRIKGLDGLNDELREDSPQGSGDLKRSGRQLTEDLS
jgi:hypothetical protein